MTEAIVEDLRVGSDRQHKYAQGLLPKSPYQTLREAAVHQGLCAVEDESLPAAKASVLLTHLNEFAKRDAPKEKPASQPSRNALSVAQVRRLVEHQIPDPPAMDPDTAWVLQRVRMAHAIVIAISTAADPMYLSHVPSGQTTLAALVERFGGVDAVAALLGVGVRTVNGWAGQLPLKYERVAQTLLREAPVPKESIDT
jgi:hypothetical protein